MKFIFFLPLLSTLAMAGKYESLTVPYVDLDRFSGDWYVQGHTHLLVDKGAVNQVESYKIHDSGRVDVTFTFYRSFDGEPTVMRPKGQVLDFGSNAHWSMQLLWPFKSDYLIVRLADDYSHTVVSVPGKNLVWIMSRDPIMQEETYNSIVNDLQGDGYKLKRLTRVQQNWD